MTSKSATFDWDVFSGKKIDCELTNDDFAFEAYRACSCLEEEHAKQVLKRLFELFEAKIIIEVDNTVSSILESLAHSVVSDNSTSNSECNAEQVQGEAIANTTSYAFAFKRD